MKILITGICGFVGSRLACWLREAHPEVNVLGIDNLSRAGSHLNRFSLPKRGVAVIHGDLRQPSDLEALPAADWVIDAAALPSVLAGIDGKVTPRQLMEHNLVGTLNLLEYCRRHSAGFVLLSSSRCYSVAALAAIPVQQVGNAFRFEPHAPSPSGVSAEGVATDFSTLPPVSLYGSSKLASETIALEYGASFSFPVIINRCGVLAGAGQFGTAEQGIFAFWLNAYLRRQPLKYIGFGGQGWQVRDMLHPEDLGGLVWRQMATGSSAPRPIYNVGGGPSHAVSLAWLSEWCKDRFGAHAIGVDSSPRRFDAPWIVMDSSPVRRDFGWCPAWTADDILSEIAKHALEHPDWLNLSRAG